MSMCYILPLFVISSDSYHYVPLLLLYFRFALFSLYHKSDGQVP